MRTRVALGAVAATMGLVAAVAPAAVGGSGGPDREAFLLAGWSGVDADTGEERSRWIISSGREGDLALVEYSIYDSMPIVCPDGSDGFQWTEGGGSGEGDLVVDRNLGGARLDGVVDVQTTTWTFCGTGDDPFVTSHGPTSLSVDLVGEGPRFTEASGGSSSTPSLFNVRWASRATGRQAQGTFTAGGEGFTAQYGDFGFVRSKTHESSTGPLEAELAAMATRLGWASRATATSGTEVGTMDRAEAISDRVDGDAYEGVYLGADHVRGEATELFYQRYATRPLACGDGTTASLDEFGFGIGPGELSMQGHLGEAAAAGSVDITTETFDGCTGESTTTTSEAVPVELALVGQGPVNSRNEWERYHVPSETNTSMWSGIRQRDASGSLRIDGDELATTWAQLLENHWRMRG